MAQNLSKMTTDHDTIRQWAEARGGKPSEVMGTARGDDVGMIRIDFPGYSGAGKLREISWDEWFRKFDESNLALVYEDETSDGQRSNFNKLIGRETMEARAEGVRTARRQPARGRTAARGRGRTSSARSRAGGAKRSTAARSRSSTAGRGASRGGARRAGRSTGRSGARATSRRGTQGRRSASRAEAARTTARRAGSKSGSRSKSGARSSSGSRSSSRSRSGSRSSR